MLILEFFLLFYCFIVVVVELIDMPSMGKMCFLLCFSKKISDINVVPGRLVLLQKSVQNIEVSNIAHIDQFDIFCQK